MLRLDSTLYGSNEARNAMRTRSYSTNDSDALEERLQQRGRSGHRFSITELLLGRQSFYSVNESVATQTLAEVSDSAENLSEETITMSTETGSHVLHEATLQTDGSEQSMARETTQTDHLNKHLLDAFLSRLSNLTGIGNPGTVYKGEEDQEGPGDYSTVYSDDLLMDRIYRRIQSKKKEKPP